MPLRHILANFIKITPIENIPSQKQKTLWCESCDILRKTEIEI